MYIEQEVFGLPDESNPTRGKMSQVHSFVEGHQDILVSTNSMTSMNAEDHKTFVF